MPDPIDAAINATAGQRIRMMQVQIPLPSGRPCHLAVPADLSADDALAICHAIPEVYARAQEAQPRVRLLLPS